MTLSECTKADKLAKEAQELDRKWNKLMGLDS